MRQNLTLVGFLFLFLAYLVVTEKRDELQVHWDTRMDPSNLSDFMYEEDTDPQHSDHPDSLSV